MRSALPSAKRTWPPPLQAPLSDAKGLPAPAEVICPTNAVMQTAANAIHTDARDRGLDKDTYTSPVAGSPLIGLLKGVDPPRIHIQTPVRGWRRGDANRFRSGRQAQASPAHPAIWMSRTALARCPRTELFRGQIYGPVCCNACRKALGALCCTVSAGGHLRAAITGPSGSPLKYLGLSLKPNS